MDKEQLNLLLNYQNEDIISRFTDLFNLSDTEAEDIFSETKKFLYLCQLPKIFIPDELLIIDEMWHNMILFTKEYHSFCEKHFGRYFHHLPATKNEKLMQQEKDKKDPALAQQEFADILTEVISAAYDHLGPDTVVKWFQVYPETYSKENIHKLRK